MNNSSEKIWLGFGSEAIVGKGLVLNPLGSSLAIGNSFNFQGSLYAKSEVETLLNGIEYQGD
ncbi:MAG TPA: hypothetical protein DDW51_05635 [Cyanobacteria bacterium UBA11367]|nr:hypothetical protein [Cyanobacteria bacterium UBA11367]HBE56765.1 hypothetical protein [Cyanobacteria bacterium UBA11366]